MRTLIQSGILATWFVCGGLEAQMLGPEVEVAARSIPTSTAGSQHHRAIAVAGSNYVVAYEDRTTAPSATNRLARVSGDGTVTELEVYLPNVVHMACAADGECAALSAPDPALDGADVSLVVSRFSDAGVLHDTTPIVLESYPRSAVPRTGSVASVPGGFVVMTATNTGVLQARTLGSAGLSAALDIAPEAAEWGLACSPTLCVAAFVDDSGVAARRFTAVPTPRAVDAAPLRLSDVASNVLVAFNGAEFRVVTPGRGYVVPSTGVTLPTPVLFEAFRAPTDFGCVSGTGDCALVSLSGFSMWLGDGTTVPPFTLGSSSDTILLACGSTACGSVLTIAGTLRGSNAILNGADWASPVNWSVGTGAETQTGPVAIAGHLAVFTRQTEVGWEVVARPLDVDGLPTGDEVPVTEAFSQPLEMVMVQTGDTYALAVLDPSDNNQFIRLDATGRPLGEVETFTNCASHLSLAWNGSNHLLGCLSAVGSDATVRRLDLAGHPITLLSTPILRSATEISVAADDAGWLIAAGQASTLRLFRMAADGRFDDPIGILVRDHGVRDVRLAQSSDGHVVAWLDVTIDVVTSEPSFELRAAFMDAALVASPVGGRTIMPLAYPTDPIALACVGSDSYLLVGDRTDTSLRRIRMVQLSSGLAPMLPVVVHTDPPVTGAFDLNHLALGGDPLAALYSAGVSEPEFAPARARLRARVSDSSCTECDGGGTDGGLGDTGMRDDSGMRDGGPGDGGMHDGSLEDGGTRDGMGGDVGEPGPASSACGCRAGRDRPSNTTGALGWLLALAVLMRRLRTTHG